MRARSKEPAISNWPEQATDNIETLTGWTQEFPGCNWGMLCGSESNRWVLDVDGRSGENFIEQQIEAHGTDWLNTTQVTTARGWHLHFAWPQGFTVANSTGKLHAGIDTKGHHGYVLVPPSQHPNGDFYSFRDSTQRVLATPPWLLELLQRSQNIGTRKRSTGETRTIPEGQRNSTLTSMAGTMRRRGMAEESIEAALQVENEAACDPPLDAAEVQTIAHSISSYEPEPQLTQRSIARVALIENSLEFETAAQYTATAASATNWIARPWIPENALTELIGAPKSAGKTSFVLALIRCVLDGVPFLGEPTQTTPVCYLSEQGESLRQSLARADLSSRDDLHLLRWPKVNAYSWSEIAAQAVQQAQQVGAKLLVLDTAAVFMKLARDEENQAGAAMAAMQPLQQAMEHGTSILLVRHSRKSDTDDLVTSARGSSAFTGMVDTVMRLRKLGATHPRTYRRLECISRYEEVPTDSILELTPQGYELRDSGEIAREAAESNLAAAIPRTEETAMTVLELSKQVHLSRRTVERTLTQLVSSGAVKRVGAGQRGCAYKFWTDSEIEGL